jgi:hypothetical protein
MPENSGSPGPATDRYNAPVVDPTANVIALVAANDRRQDDLREITAKHLKEIVSLRAAYDAELRGAESNRIDAIRLVDTGNVTRAAEVSAAQATALATSQIQSAEALRVQVEATRITTQDALTTALQPIQAAIESLRQTQFQQQGEKAAGVESRGDVRYYAGQRRESTLDARTLFFAACALIVSIIGAAALIGAHL